MVLWVQQELVVVDMVVEPATYKLRPTHEASVVGCLLIFARNIQAGWTTNTVLLEADSTGIAVRGAIISVSP